MFVHVSMLLDVYWHYVKALSRWLRHVTAFDQVGHVIITIINIIIILRWRHLKRLL